MIGELHAVRFAAPLLAMRFTVISRKMRRPQKYTRQFPMTASDSEKQARDAKLAAARAKSEERRIAHAKLKQHMRDTAIPIRPQTDEQK